MTRFTKWTHPVTGSVRIYISGVAGQGGAKIYVEQQAADSFGETFNIRIQGANVTRGEAGNLINAAEREITEAAGRRVKTFEDVLALAV